MAQFWASRAEYNPTSDLYEIKGILHLYKELMTSVFVR